MTIEEMRKHEWIVSWSGGKDSTATIIKMHEYNIPISSICYVRIMYNESLPATLPVMTDFIDKAIKVFESWGYTVNVHDSLKTAEDLIYAKYIRSKYKDRNGHYHGITSFGRGACWMTGIKVATIKKYEKTGFHMVGYAADEVKRLHRLNAKKQSILVALNITEAEAFNICREYDLLSPLYDLGIKRDGCFFCPNVSKREIALLVKDYPQLVELNRHMLDICDYDLGAINEVNNWVKYFKESRR